MPGLLVIADDAKPLALAGSWAGRKARSARRTRDMFLESAFFSPEAIAGNRAWWDLPPTPRSALSAAWILP